MHEFELSSAQSSVHSSGCTSSCSSACTSSTQSSACTSSCGSACTSSAQSSVCTARSLAALFGIFEEPRGTKMEARHLRARRSCSAREHAHGTACCGYHVRSHVGRVRELNILKSQLVRIAGRRPHLKPIFGYFADQKAPKAREIFGVLSILSSQNTTVIRKNCWSFLVELEHFELNSKFYTHKVDLLKKKIDR